MSKFKVGFNRRSAAAVSQIVKRTAEQQLSGLSPAERDEILQNILVARNPGGSSLNVQITSKAALKTQFGSRKLQRRMVAPLRAALSDLLTPKR